MVIIKNGVNGAVSGKAGSVPNPITSYTVDFDQENGVLRITWEYDAYLEKKFDTRFYDSFLILYNAADNGVEYPLLINDSKNKLITGKQAVNIPKHRKEATYEVYLFFVESYGGGEYRQSTLGQDKIVTTAINDAII